MRVQRLQDKIKNTDQNADKIAENFQQIEKYLQASEEIIKREAHEHPKIQKSYEELEAEIKKLEDQITALQTKQQQLQERLAESERMRSLLADALVPPNFAPHTLLEWTTRDVSTQTEPILAESEVQPVSKFRALPKRTNSAEKRFTKKLEENEELYREIMGGSEK
ncbi:8021_t:CDS:2 [Racocetra persica]|uniref:8021_t:CDS:1 n=1 Tax=Racocetra persica TaxID=160502 RepID=A0ACA9QHR7_9GLOM|nr:8021_t:CDS:2 [Racocetra persica]